MKMTSIFVDERANDPSRIVLTKQKRSSSDDDTKTTERDRKTDGMSQSALELLRGRAKNGEEKKIITFCRDLDMLMGGGIPVSAITEFCGEPGAGKTQFGMQLAANVQVPPACGGLGGGAVFVDTEGSFMPERMVQIADAVIAHLNDTACRHKNKAERTKAAQSVTRETVLSNVWCFRVHDYTEQMCTIKSLDAFVEKHAACKIKLIVIDSISFHFRRDFNDMGKRSRVLSEMASCLHALARKYKLAVVMTNQMTTRFMKRDHRVYPPRHTNGADDDDDSDDRRRSREAVLVPALGETWSHVSTNRIRLRRPKGTGVRRIAHLVKSPSHAPGRAYYRITERGVRGLALPQQSVPDRESKRKTCDESSSALSEGKKRGRGDFEAHASSNGEERCRRVRVHAESRDE